MTSVLDSVAEVDSDIEATLKPAGMLRRVFRNPVAIVCMIYLAAVLGVAVIAPIMMPEISDQNAGDLLSNLQGPSDAHWLGTDSLGRDVFDRLLVGTRVTLVGVAQALVVALAAGVPAGLVAGYFGGRIDRAISWVADLIFSIPGIVIMLVVLGIFPGNMTAAMSVFGLMVSPTILRVVRSAALTVREELYVAAAQVAGLSAGYIIFRHVLPRVAGAAITQASLVTATALIAQSGLAFLGLIASEPAPSWGGMVANGLDEMQIQSWLIWPPGLAITLTAIALALLADCLRDAAAESWSTTSTQGTKSARKVASAAQRAVQSADDEAGADDGAVLSVRNLHVAFHVAGAVTPVIEDVSFDIRAGETVGLVGESGSGKSITARAIMGLLPGNAVVGSGTVRYDGRQIAGLPERAMRHIRGSEIALIAQEPMITLDPSFKIGNQLLEVVRKHHALSRSEGKERVLDLLRQVHLPEPEAVAQRYPHEVSGGMAQRIAIARALAGEPKLLIADEPTTALDVTVQAAILQLLREIQRDRNMAMLLVTHDWGVVADICDRAVVMYAGQVVERASIEDLFDQPRHPYSTALIASDPRHAEVGGKLPTIGGQPPSLGDWSTGCRFSLRCAFVTPECVAEPIPIVPLPGARETRCIHHSEVVSR